MRDWEAIRQRMQPKADKLLADLIREGLLEETTDRMSVRVTAKGEEWAALMQTILMIEARNVLRQHKAAHKN